MNTRANDPVAGEKAELSDMILSDILDNPDADRCISEAAIQRAIARGMSEAMAHRLYG